MSEKALDKHGRWRSVSQNFRSSPEENEMIRFNVRVSGLSKQEYLVSRALEKEFKVHPGPRLYKALNDELKVISKELKRLVDSNETIEPETIDKLEIILGIIEKLEKNNT